MNGYEGSSSPGKPSSSEINKMPSVRRKSS